MQIKLPHPVEGLELVRALKGTAMMLGYNCKIGTYTHDKKCSKQISFSARIKVDGSVRVLDFTKNVLQIDLGEKYSEFSLSPVMTYESPLRHIKASILREKKQNPPEKVLLRFQNQLYEILNSSAHD